MMQVSSSQLARLAKAASYLSVPCQRSLLHCDLLRTITPLKSTHLSLSTNAITNPLQRSLFTSEKIHHRCIRTELPSLLRTFHCNVRPSSISGQRCHQLYSSKSSDHSRITSRLLTPHAGQYIFRNSPLLAQSNLLVSGTLRFKSSQSSSRQSAWRERNRSVMLYVIAGAVLVVGFSYAAVPLYTVFCQATGLGGQATAGHDIEKVETMAPVRGRELVIRFNADTAASMRWNFRPQQSEVKVVPGETALAFYSAMNPTNKPIVGISTYNVVPFDAGQYFNKIQCFCFEEQRLNPHEQVDMPVFFYIDPEFDDDPKMQKVDNITLSYTFFESKEGLELPDPWARPE